MGLTSRVSSIFLKKEGLMHKFEWQSGYGAFSCSKSHVDRLIKYIMNQREHHKTKHFRDEYQEYLREHEIEFDPRFLFEFHE